MEKLRIYLSPSKQPFNRYVVGNTNEEAEMVGVARRMKAILDEEYECEAILATLTLAIGAEGRAGEARERKCDVYLALHSNAGGQGRASGAVAFYHRNKTESRTLAENIVQELNSACSIATNRSRDVADGMDAFDGKGYGEIRVPEQYGMVPVLAETNFHDNPATAQWIISSKPAIARAYVNALVRSFDLKRKSEEIIVYNEAAQADKKFYRVQVGAYSKKENAEDMNRKLKELGIEAYIRYT